MFHRGLCRTAEFFSIISLLLRNSAILGLWPLFFTRTYYKELNNARNKVTTNHDLTEG